MSGPRRPAPTLGDLGHRAQCIPLARRAGGLGPAWSEFWQPAL